MNSITRYLIIFFGLVCIVFSETQEDSEIPQCTESDFLSQITPCEDQSRKSNSKIYLKINSNFFIKETMLTR